MKDESKTKARLIAEIREVRLRSADHERAEQASRSAESALRRAARRAREKQEESEQKLGKNLAQLNAIINALPGLVSVVDTDFNVLIANDEVYKRFGKGSLREVIGKPCYAARKDLAEPCPHCALVRAFDTGETISRLSTPEEEKLVGMATKSYAIPLRDESGELWGGVEVIVDVSDIRKAEENLREREEQMQLALQGADLGLWDWNIASGSISYNQRLAEMLGYSPTGIEPEFSSWMERIHPDDLPQVRAAIQAHLEGKTRRFESEHRIRLGGDSWRWVLVRGKVMERDGDGTPLRAAGTHLDITRRKQAEQKLRESEENYRALIDGMRDTAWVIGFDGRFLDVNRSAVEILGYSRAELLTMGPADIDLNLDESAIENLIRDMPTDKIQVFETVHATKGGEQIPVEIQSVLVIYQGQEAILSIGRDITDRKQAEEERLKLRKLESVGVLAGGIAHDFNNLLTGLFGNLEMAKMLISTDHKAYEFLETAGESLDNATKLTRQLLTFARGGDPIKQTLSIGESLAETAEFSLRGSNARLAADIAGDLWPVEADKGQLSQVVSNLVINAQQAMPDGGIIRLTADNHEPTEGRFVRITVRDEGVGIAPRHLDRIFDPYFTTKQRGSGLGLAITHSIITKHEGSIAVDSTVGGGTTFTVLLPAAEAVEAAAPAGSADDREDDSLPALRILILDDQNHVRKALASMLEKLGHRATSTSSGNEAIDEFRRAMQDEAPYDVVITDLTLPGGIGGEMVAREILAVDPQARIIVSSGYATDAIMANYETHGFQGRIVKPYHLSELKSVLKQVLNAREDATGFCP